MFLEKLGEIDMNNLLGNLIKKFRADNNLTQIQFAKKTRLNYTHISRIESGKYKEPRMATIKKLAKALGVSISGLMGVALASTQPYMFDDYQDIPNVAKVANMDNNDKLPTIDNTENIPPDSIKLLGKIEPKEKSSKKLIIEPKQGHNSIILELDSYLLIEKLNKLNPINRLKAETFINNLLIEEQTDIIKK